MQIVLDQISQSKLAIFVSTSPFLSGEHQDGNAIWCKVALGDENAVHVPQLLINVILYKSLKKNIFCTDSIPAVE